MNDELHLGITLVCFICGIIIYRRRKTSSEAQPPVKLQKDKQLPKPQPKNEKNDSKPQLTKPWKSITGVTKKDDEQQKENLPVSKKTEKQSSSFVTPLKKDEPISKKLHSPPQVAKTPVPAQKFNAEPVQQPSSLEKDEPISKRLPSPPQIVKTSEPLVKVSPKITKGMSLSSFKRIKRVERDEAKEAAEFEKELLEEERRAVEEAKKQMRPISLNIDKNARSKDEVQKSTETEMTLIKKLCGEVREIAKASNAEEREERKKEMDKVRSAR